jgi:adenosylcobinamide kinase/adenosylcobinamide-phosphate guanylyltransferase
MKTLILGGVRSGKSRLAETMAQQSGLAVTYIATASGDDDAMAKRILTHQQRRPHAWGNIEEKIHLARAIESVATRGHCILIDCLSLWVTNLLLSEDEALIQDEMDALLECLTSVPAEVIMVSSESNMGVIPMGELSRRYCDLIGQLHQQVAAESERVVMTIAGLPHTLKGDKV